jgi:hypothetical protein
MAPVPIADRRSLGTFSRGPCFKSSQFYLALFSASPGKDDIVSSKPSAFVP